MAMAAFMSGKPGDCGRTFYLAFANHPENPGDTSNPSASYTATHNVNGAVIRQLKTGNIRETITGAYQDDNYDLLKKAIGGYNQGQGVFDQTNSWSELLLTHTSTSDSAVVTAMKYAIDILQTPERGVSLPARQYIWEGGTYPADLVDDQGQPDPKAGTDWCFAWGEQEWLANSLFEDIKVAADLYDEEGDEKEQTGAINCLTGAAI